MKIICSKSNLLKGVNIVSKAVPSKTTMAILECILIDATTGIIKLTANDMELGIETKIEGDVLEKGLIALDAKIFSEIVRKLPDNDVIIETDSNLQTTITCEKAKFHICGKSGEDFSYLPYVEKEDSIELSQFTLKEVIRQTIFSIADNENNKLMTGELFEVADGMLKVVSLDGHRISIRKVELKENYPAKKVVVPGKTLIEVIEKPKWRYKETDNFVEQSKTLTPDLISIYPYKDNYCFAILDAKYYLIKLTKHSIEGNPGVGDVTKQYLYQLAYQDFIDKCGFKYIQNAFLMPIDDEKGEFVGTAEFNMMRDAGNRLEHISVIKLPAKKLYQAYLNGRPDLELFDLLKIAPIKRIDRDSFSKRMMSYLKAGKAMELDNNEGKRIYYPEQIRSNIGGKVLFDIIAPEVGRHSYTYSPYRKDSMSAMADNVSDTDMEKRIVRFIETLISKYVEAIQKNTIGIEECLLLVNNMVNEWDFREIKEQEKHIAETLQILYQ